MVIALAQSLFVDSSLYWVRRVFVESRYKYDCYVGTWPEAEGCTSYPGVCW